MSDTLTKVDNALILAQGKTTLDADTSGFQGFDVNFDDSTITLFRVIGFAIFLIWGIYAAWKFSLPENRGGKIMDRIGGVGPLVMAALAVTCLVDMNKTVDVLNIILKGARAAVNAVTSGFN